MKDPNEHNIESLHRELIEARNLAIKTDNLVKNLSADIKAIAKRQESYQRKYLFNSAVAYVLFVIVIFTGLYLLFGARTGSYKQEVMHFESRNRLLQGQLDDARGELERRRHSEDRAYQFFELIESGQRDEVVDQFIDVQAELVDRAMIELLRARVSAITYDLADEAFREGVVQLNNEQWSDARDHFLDSLGYLERTPWAPELHYYLGRSLYNLEDYEGSVQYFDNALAAEELDGALQAMGQYLRGLALEETGRLSEALDAFRQFRDEFSTHRYTGRALHHMNGIQRTLDHSASDD